MADRLVQWGRLVVWVAVAGWLLIAPAARHVGDSDSPAFNQWAMFVGYGLDVCVVEFRQVVDGKKQKLDRLKTLGFDRWVDVRQHAKLVRSERAAERQGQLICNALGQGVDVRMRGRCASRRGWKRPAWRGKSNICSSQDVEENQP